MLRSCLAYPVVPPLNVVQKLLPPLKVKQMRLHSQDKSLFVSRVTVSASPLMKQLVEDLDARCPRRPTAPAPPKVRAVAVHQNK